jgi:hypothetical protein
MDEAKMNEVGMQYFLASLGPNDLTNIDLQIVPGNGKVTISVTGDYTPKIANIFGATQFAVGTSTEAMWNMGKVEIALVLDSSLSMGQGSGRIEALRAATVDLLNVLENASKNPGDAKVGIVAFDGMVNVGSSNSNAAWLRWDWWDANAYDSIGNRCKIGGSSVNFSVNSVTPGKWLKQHCEEQFTTSSSCVGANGNNRTQCQSRGGKWVTTNTYGVWTPLNRNQWAGCVYDRENEEWPGAAAVDYDVQDDAPNLTNPNTANAVQRQTKYPAAKCYATPPQSIMALSEDWNALRTKATNLTPTGSTNITVGLAWGWHLLSPTELYTQGAAYDAEDLTKYIILMTDGDNTKSIWKEPRDCLNNASCISELDGRTLQACTNIKAAGVQIFTIRLIQGNANLLRSCATNEGMYHEVQSAGALAGVFNSIGAEIASLHLSK